jgi:hypothetical protein
MNRIQLVETFVRREGAEEVRELVEFARGQGYAVNELVEMIEDVA